MSTAGKSRNPSPTKKTGSSAKKVFDFSKNVGNHVRCTLIGDDVVEGIVYLHDSQSKALLIYASRAGDKFNDLRIINTAQIRDYSASPTSPAPVPINVSETSATKSQAKPLEKVDVQRTQTASTASRAKKEGQNGKPTNINTSNPSSRRGSRPETPIKSVPNTPKPQMTEECKTILDGLSRHFKCRVQGGSIIVSDEYKIDAPYTAESTKPLKSELNEALNAGLVRLKKVLESERSVLFVHKKASSGGGSRKKKDEKLPVKGG